MIALVASLGFTGPSFAALGGTSASIEADRAHLAARSNMIVNSAYSVHVMTLPNGGSVKEFERSDGTVFAIAWKGPSRPDLRQLMGARFDAMQSDIALRRVRGRRSPLAAQTSDFVLHSAGHSGAFAGVAYIPQLAPTGVSVSALQ